MRKIGPPSPSYVRQLCILANDHCVTVCVLPFGHLCNIPALVVSKFKGTLDHLLSSLRVVAVSKQCVVLQTWNETNSLERGDQAYNSQ